MKLEQQLTSLEISKRLKELGVREESLYSWFQKNKDKTYEKWTYQHDVPFVLLHTHEKDVSTKHFTFEEIFSAFTCSELGEMLPFEVVKKGATNQGGDIGYQLSCFKEPQRWHIVYMCGISDWLCDVYGDTEADARGKMLIYLLENKLINP